MADSRGEWKELASISERDGEGDLEERKRQETAGRSQQVTGDAEEAEVFLGLRREYVLERIEQLIEDGECCYSQRLPQLTRIVG